VQEPRPLPEDWSFAGLFGPQRDYAYFAGAADVPFLPGATGFERANAWWLAEASLLAYVPEEDFVRGAWARAGFPEVAFFAKDRTHAHAAANDEAVIVTFRGTDSVERFPQNLKLFLVRNRRGGRVHEGYVEALAAVWADLRRHLDGRPCFFGGHSLGAGLAILAASRYPAARALYTFGAPRVGDKEFRDAFPVPAFRFVNNNDLVTRLPPGIGYTHVGELKYFGADGALRESPALWDRIKDQVEGHLDHATAVLERWREGDRKAVAYASLVDHAPICYATLCWNACVRPVA
jgi:triacylglycerol lipase